MTGGNFTETQTITLSNASGGTWRVAYNGEVSAPLSPSITASQLKSVLDGFNGIDNVTVTGGSGSFTVTFGGTQSTTNMFQIFGDAANASNGSTVRTITTTYDASSQVTSVSDPSSTINFTLDNLGRATTIAQSVNGLTPTVTLNQSFDAMTNRTELKAAIGSTLDFKNTFQYDQLQRLTDIVQQGQSGGHTVLAKHVTFAYNALNQRTQIARYQSTGTTSAVATTDFTYDSANRLSGIAHKQGSTNLNTYAYTYDPLSRIATIVSTLEGTDTYSYDQTSQLVGATHTSQSNETYGFDANGNQNTTGFTTGTNNQTTAGLGFTYTFDDEGNRTSKTETATGKVEEYTWDSRNRLTKVVFRNSSGGAIVKQVDYEYDPYNRLVHRTFDADGAGSGAATDQFWVYDEGINAVLQFDGSSASNLSHRYLWSNNVDELLADEQVAGSNTLWGLADHLGSLRDIADLNEGTGVTSITNHRTFNSFGKLISETNAAVDMLFAFTGKHYDDATALQHNLFRWYDPAIGQWLIEDPLSFAAGDENVRRYVGNDAILRLDPLGLYNQDEIDQIKTSALSTLEKAGLYKAKALKENEDYDRLTKAQNRLRDDDQGFYIRDIFDCSEYARIAIATLRESIGDTRLRIDYIRGRNETMEDLLLDASARSQVESHAMMLLRIKDQYLVYDPQTGNSSNWQTGNESQALKAAAELYNKHYSDIQEKVDDDVRAAIDSFTKFSIVDVKDYANKDMNSAAYKLFLQAVKENGGKPSLLPPIPNTPSFNPNRPRK